MFYSFNYYHTSIHKHVFGPSSSDISDISELFQNKQRVVRCVNGTVDLKLQYKDKGKEEIIQAFVDADWANVFKLFGNTVSWSSKKQLCCNPIVNRARVCGYVSLCYRSSVDEKRNQRNNK